MSDPKSLLDASSRVALAAFLHDLGKFAERARIEEADSMDLEGNRRSDLNKQLYCPKFKDHYTHVHAAYTAIGFDVIEKHLPEIIGSDMYPFKPWKDRDADDSLINAAAMHHKPETFLQWVIATADRVASGFERQEFAEYNESEEKRNHYNTRQLTLVEQITLEEPRPEPSAEDLEWCYKLKPLSSSALFPVERKGYEANSNTNSQAEYRELWNGFVSGLALIPESHRRDLSLWLDHFETLWGTYTYAIPSATVGKTLPDVSLYDHSRTTAALAVALWRYHQHDDTEAAREELTAQWDVKRQDVPLSQTAWSDKKFLLIQGDFFGIQNFIFSAGSETQKRAAKLLRGRSFYISLLTECAALKVLDALDLPSTSQVINAAGKFLIVAPNTPEVTEKLKTVQGVLDDWFLKHSYGQSGVGLAWLPASSNDFRKSDGQTQEPPFQKLVKRLFEALELKKHKRMQMVDQAAPAPVFEEFLDSFNNEQGVCAIDGHSAGVVKLKDTERYICQLAKDQIDVGGYLTKFNRFLICRKDAQLLSTQELRPLGLDIFGFRLAFTKPEQSTGKFKPLVDKRSLLRAIDFSIPNSESEVLWNGYARRYINAYVPIVSERDLTERDHHKYQKVSDDLSFGDLKTLNHIACDDRKVDTSGKWKGQTALMTLKGDVDDLGSIFQKGLGAPTFAKMAALSRQMNAFFAIHLPQLCHAKYPSAYTVFAGGDDFFLIGPWHSMMKLSLEMQQDFERYAAMNNEVHFSSGLSMTKPGLPIRYLAERGEEALDNAKAYSSTGGDPTKNAVSCFSRVVPWKSYKELMQLGESLEHHKSSQSLSTGYVYGLLNLVDMREAMDQGKPENAIWRSYFSYRTYRLLERQRNLSGDERKERHAQLAQDIAANGIELHKGDYKVALFSHLYQQRD
ncbi:type III-A CRISPR-associated protein Cas10/Csm1 [Leucothrix pacifica]|uniref:CRISPR system single-strand-specific deoxyribonuclease Cas10/Csm1 (subtype III-A) n=1 Tax=Leucothrix pacifica TaxID=1247513 RepID=A0A317CHP2_9GAMM|nr:type III-A CRISPR-associated protein Cas10/Csm1 [Leucothrix pacifica]PWQ97651.1 type III-A CRISPR-associated protein Cas10/Csm1 [Leucothrix pacifica]